MAHGFLMRTNASAAWHVGRKQDGLIVHSGLRSIVITQRDCVAD